MTTATKIPSDFPVKELKRSDFAKAKDPATCGTCGRSWDDAIPTTWTPAPSARCPFEYFHEDEDDAPLLTEADADNDEFKCDRCGRVCDIEDSIRQGKDKLNCVYCTAPSPIEDQTRLPWYAETIAGHHCVFNSDGDQVLTTSKTRAAFIVKAVNSHDALVAALREMRAQFFLHDCEPTIDCAKCNVLDATDRALNSTTKGDE